MPLRKALGNLDYLYDFLIFCFAVCFFCFLLFIIMNNLYFSFFLINNSSLIIYQKKKNGAHDLWMIMSMVWLRERERERFKSICCSLVLT